MGRLRTYRGFTLVEMLVVIAIIGVLIALLLPAIQAAREAARRATCQANLKQLALAMHSHHDGRNRLPAAAMFGGREYRLIDEDTTPGDGSDDDDAAPFSWQVALLAYIEADAIYDEFNFDHGPFNSTESDNLQVTARAVPVFHCPSFSGGRRTTADDYEESTDGVRPALGQYVALGATTLERLRGDPDGGRFEEKPDGVIYHQDKTKFRRIKDGMSQTLFLTETREEQYAVWADGSTATLCGIHPNIGNGASFADGGTSAAAINRRGDEEAAYWKSGDDFGGGDDMTWGVSSEHPGLAMHAFVDGSVQSIDEEIEGHVYHALITRSQNDGRLAQVFFEK